MRVILIFVLLIGGISFSEAQSGALRTPEERAERIIEDQTFKAFKMASEQKAKVLTILIAQNKSLDSLINTIPPGNNTQRSIIQVMAPKRVAIIALNDKKIIALLDDEQKKAYEAYVAKRPPGSVFGGIGANSPAAGSGVSR